MTSKEGGWMGTAEAAGHLGITTRTLYKLIDEGEAAAYKFGRVIRVRQTDVEDYLQRSRIAPGTLGHLYPGGDGDGT